MCMIHITVRWDLLSHSNTAVRDFNLMAVLCLLILSHQSHPLPTQCCRMACLPPPHHCHLCPCVCPWTQTRTTHSCARRRHCHEDVGNGGGRQGKASRSIVCICWYPARVIPKCLGSATS